MVDRLAVTTRTIYTPHIGRTVRMREGTSDPRVWADTFTGRYHVPPPDMPTPSSILDVGANIGLVAADYRHLFPWADVVAVEMDAENADLAEANSGCRVIRAAVAAVGGEAAYSRAAAADAYALDPAGNELVWAVTLREACEMAFPGGDVDLVKLDVEGAEWKILERADEFRRLVRHLLVELHAPAPDGDASPAGMVAEAERLLLRGGYASRRHPPHPQAIYARRI